MHANVPTASPTTSAAAAWGMFGLLLTFFDEYGTVRTSFGKKPKQMNRYDLNINNSLSKKMFDADLDCNKENFFS